LNAARDAGLNYAGRGWRVFPLPPGEKEPVGRTHGQNDSTDDPEEIRRMFQGAALWNLGIHCRPSGLYVIDIDMNPWKGKAGKATWDALVALHGHVETYTVRTWSGGLHFYYSHPEGFLANTAGDRGGLGLDVDTRGNGYVVAAPSFIRETHEGVVHEGSYEVIDDRDPAPLPQWIIDALRKPEPKQRTVLAPLASDGRVLDRVRAIAAELAGCVSGANDLAASLSTKVGNYVGAGQVDLDQATGIMLQAVEGWTWVRAEDRTTMHNTIRRQIAFGSQRDDRPWEAPVSEKNGLWDKYAQDTVPDPTPASTPPPQAAVAPPQAKTATTEVGHGQYRMAQRMLREHGEDLRYSSALGWYGYDGIRWVPDRSGDALRKGHETIDAAYRDVPSQASTEKRKDFLKDIGAVESASGAKGMLQHLSAMLPVAAGEDPFDRKAHLFNTPGGVLDLLAGGCREHDRKDMISKVAGGELGTERSPLFDAFLERILPDPDVRAYVQRLFGQAMLGRVTEHILPIFTGEGRNGKGTLRDAVRHAFGDYALEVDPDILMEQKHSQHKTFLMELMGRRLVFCSEGDRGRKFAEATMKRLVGGDEIQANRMHHDPVTYSPSHTLIMLTNHLPKVSGDDPAIWARIQVVPFSVVIPVSERDGNLPERLKAEAPAVLAWVHEGWLEYQKQGLNPPEAVRASTRKYQDDSDSMSRFLDENSISNPHESIQAKAFYEVYTKWSHDEGEHAETSVMFANSLKARGIDKKRTSRGMRYQGVMLAGDYAADYS
jgi:putative DNA primase/helicase